MPEELTPEERSAQLLARLGSKGAATPPSILPPKQQFDADLVPDITYEKSPEQQRLDGVLSNIDIVDAYRRLIGKMEPEVKGKTEGIKISCPMPNHPDKDPSAWINTQKQTWFCGGCQVGGDVYDLAAIHFGYDLQAYKSKNDFPILRRQLAETFGYTIVSGIAGEQVVKNEPEEVEDEPAPDVVPPVQEPPAPEPAVVPEPEPSPPMAPPALASVTQITAAPTVRKLVEQDDIDSRDIFIPWDKILPYETFSRGWMEATTIDDLPHEYYFFLAMQALGFACGHNNIMSDFQDVKPNLFICLYGRTGLGKSRSMRPYLRLLEEVFPFQGDPTTLPEGVRILPTPGSGESIIDAFAWNVIDPATNKTSGQAPISGLLRHEELSGLVSKAARSGSSIKEVLIEMYDVHGGDVTTMSRTSGVARAHNPFCQMISTTQPNAIHAFLRKVDIESGFLNRWIFAAGIPRIAPIAYGGVVQDITAPAQLLRDVTVWAKPGHRFHLEGEALEAWKGFFQTHMAPYKSGQVAQESIFSRVDLTLKKLIVCLTADERRDQPTGDLVERVLMLYPYLQTTYGMFAQDITFNDITDCQTRIIAMAEKYVEEGKTPPTKRDFVRALTRKFDGETVVRSLRNLLDLDMLAEQPVNVGARGRPTMRYVLPGD